MASQATMRRDRRGRQQTITRKQLAAIREQEQQRAERAFAALLASQPESQQRAAY